MEGFLDCSSRKLCACTLKSLLTFLLQLLAWAIGEILNRKASCLFSHASGCWRNLRVPQLRIWGSSACACSFPEVMVLLSFFIILTVVKYYNRIRNANCSPMFLGMLLICLQKCNGVGSYSEVESILCVLQVPDSIHGV